MKLRTGSLLGELGMRAHELPRPVPSTLYAGFAVYSLLVSEAVAAWFWALSVPATAAVAVCLVLLLARAPQAPRRFFFHYMSYDLAGKSRRSPFPAAPDLARSPSVCDPWGWIAARHPLEAQAWHDRHGRLRREERRLPDLGYRWKQGYFPQLGEPAWRVEVGRYACAPR